MKRLRRADNLHDVTVVVRFVSSSLTRARETQSAGNTLRALLIAQFSLVERSSEGKKARRRRKVSLEASEQTFTKDRPVTNVPRILIPPRALWARDIKTTRRKKTATRELGYSVMSARSFVPARRQRKANCLRANVRSLSRETQFVEKHKEQNR